MVHLVTAANGAEGILGEVIKKVAIKIWKRRKRWIVENWTS